LEVEQQILPFLGQKRQNLEQLLVSANNGHIEKLKLQNSRIKFDPEFKSCEVVFKIQTQNQRS